MPVDTTAKQPKLANTQSKFFRYNNPQRLPCYLPRVNSETNSKLQKRNGLHNEAALRTGIACDSL